MTDYTIVNPFIGHGIVLVSGEDAAATEKLALAISEALPHAAPANLGFTNGEPDGDLVSDKKGLSVRLFASASDEEIAAVKQVVG